jgi:hypothetical protein
LELLLITEPELRLRDRRSERLCSGFLCDHPGSLDARIRNDAADCADAAECDADCNNQSNGELLAAAQAHGDRLHQASERTIQSLVRPHCPQRSSRDCEPVYFPKSRIITIAFVMAITGFVSKRLARAIAGGRSKDWLKFKNPNAPVVKRLALAVGLVIGFIFG